jgi:hypothetical protein
VIRKSKTPPSLRSLTAVPPGVQVTDARALARWLDDDHQHSLYCAARDEGLDCCLDLILEVARAAAEEGA